MSVGRMMVRLLAATTDSTTAEAWTATTEPTAASIAAVGVAKTASGVAVLKEEEATAAAEVSATSASKGAATASETGRAAKEERGVTAAAETALAEEAAVAMAEEEEATVGKVGARNVELARMAMAVEEAVRDTSATVVAVSVAMAMTTATRAGAVKLAAVSKMVLREEVVAAVGMARGLRSEESVAVTTRVETEKKAIGIAQMTEVGATKMTGEVAVKVRAAAGMRAAAEAEVRLREPTTEAAEADMEGARARVREEVTAVAMMEAPATAQS